MSKTPAKTKRNDAAALLELLKTVLPKAALDPETGGQIYAAVERELFNKVARGCLRQVCANACPCQISKPPRWRKFSSTTRHIFRRQRCHHPAQPEGKIPGRGSLAADGTQLVKEIKVRPVAPDADNDRK